MNKDNEPLCVMCDKPLPYGQRKYCSKVCNSKSAMVRTKKYREKNPELANKWNREGAKRFIQNLRDQTIEYLGGFICVNCGCTDKRILEINHVNLGGGKEEKKKERVIMYREIITGKRDGEFNVLCKVCNAAHYCNEKFGTKFSIEYINNIGGR